MIKAQARKISDQRWTFPDVTSVVKQGSQGKMLCSLNIMDSTKHPGYSPQILSPWDPFTYQKHIATNRSAGAVSWPAPGVPRGAAGSVNGNLIAVRSLISLIKVFPGTAWRARRRSSRCGGSGKEETEGLAFPSPSIWLFSLLNPWDNKGGCSEWREHSQRRMLLLHGHGTGGRARAATPHPKKNPNACSV